MLSTIISSQTRLKLLIKFFLSTENQGYLRGLEKELQESSNSIRVELKKFIDAGLLVSDLKGKKRYYRANPNHPLFKDISCIVRKSVGINQILNCNLTETGNLEAIFIMGKLARGIESDTIELALIGQNLDLESIDTCIKSAERKIKKKIMYLIYTSDQMQYFFKNQPFMKIWKVGNQLVSH